jgi:ketosteroid isomerase-like protein
MSNDTFAYVVDWLTMSAAENKKLIRQAFAKWAGGDADAVFKLLADDVRWTVIGSTRVSRSYQSKREFWKSRCSR